MPNKDPFDRALKGNPLAELPEDPEIKRRILGVRTKAEFIRAHNLNPDLTRKRPQQRDESDSDSSTTEEDSASDEEDSVISQGTTHLSKSLRMASRMTFNGKQTRKLTEFLTIAEADFKLDDDLNGSQEKKAAYIISRLRDTAFNWYMQAVKSDEDIGTEYDTLKRALKERFDISDEEKRDRAQITLGRVQQKGTVQSYSTFFDALVEEAGWQHQDNLTVLFVNGLYPSIQRAIKTNPSFDDNSTMDWIRVAARRHEAAYAATRPYGSGPSTPRTNRTGNACFACGNTGHWARDCPNRRTPRRGGTQPPPYDSLSTIRNSQPGRNTRQNTPGWGSTPAWYQNTD